MVTVEMVQERAKLYAAQTVGDLVKVIRRQSSMTNEEYTQMFRECVESAFVIGHAAGVGDQYADSSLATRSGL